MKPQNLLYRLKRFFNGESGRIIKVEDLLTDEKPQLEILNAEANKRWREGCMNYFLSGYYSERDMLLFK